MYHVFLLRYGGTSNYGRTNNIGGGGWSAPKPANQGYGRNTGIGGGGFVAPGGVGGRTNYGYKGSSPTFSNSYGRYGGGTSVLGNRRSSSLFGGGGTRAFGIGAGAGFLGNFLLYIWELFSKDISIRFSKEMDRMIIIIEI